MNRLTEYESFLAEKVAFDHAYGFEVGDDQINPVLKPHQRDIVRWAVRGGRRAIFARFGLGKSVMQLEVLRLIIDRILDSGANARGLIVAPLGVRTEFIHDARELLGMEVRFIRRTEEIEPTWSGIYVTNYESVRDGRLDVNLFDTVSLDEAAVLRSFGSKTYQTFLSLFDAIPYRFVATATPSPNKYKELIHYAGFLGVMDTGQALTRFFKRDSTQANNLTLYPHKIREFWLWLNTWACFLQRPSDLGYSDEGYDLPDVVTTWHAVETGFLSDQTDRDGQGVLLRGQGMSMVDASREKRATMESRVACAMQIVESYVHGRSEAGVRPGVRAEESGEAERSSAGALRGGSGEAGSAARTSEAVARRQSGEVRRAAGPRGQGEGERALDGVVPGEQGARSGDAATEQAEARVRPDAGAVRGDVGGAERPMRDLQDRDDRASRGPRPQDGDGARTALHAVQLGARDVPGQHGSACGGDPVSDQLILWCDLNDEQDALERGLDALGVSYSSVHGSLSDDEVERRLQEWRGKRTTVLIGKPIMLGQGMNLQQCHVAIWVGVTYKFNDTIQSLHRVQRYGQTHTVEAHFIYAETEAEVRDVLERKWREHDELTETMSDVIREYGLNPAAIQAELTRSMGVQRREESGEDWLIANNDCVPETMAMDAESVDLVVTSIPFSNHYEYTPSYNDFGHTDDNGHFWRQMDYLTPELLRILKPGRIYACHVKDRILFGSVTGAGAPTVSPFHAEALFHGRQHGFDYLGMITVTTDVVRENNQTYRLGYTEMRKDGTKMGVGSPEYILLFRKPQTDRAKGYADERVVKSIDDYSLARWQIDAAADWRSSGNRLLTVDELAQLSPEARSRLFTKQSVANVYDFDAHVALGEEMSRRNSLPATFKSLDPGSWSPWVWHDVNRMLTLNGEQARRNLEFHICPLQFDIVDRLIERYSNKGDLVFDPFGGLGTVPLRARKLGRRGRAVELNPTSYRDAVAYQQEMDRSGQTPTLFDLLEMDGAA